MKVILTLGILVISFSACNQKCEKTEVTEVVELDTEALDSLTLKLDATEAQLYNVRMELSKCKGDSIPD